MEKHKELLVQFSPLFVKNELFA